MLAEASNDGEQALEGLVVGDLARGDAACQSSPLAEGLVGRRRTRLIQAGQCEAEGTQGVRAWKRAPMLLEDLERARVPVKGVLEEVTNGSESFAILRGKNLSLTQPKERFFGASEVQRHGKVTGAFLHASVRRQHGRLESVRRYE